MADDKKTSTPQYAPGEAPVSQPEASQNAKAPGAPTDVQVNDQPVRAQVKGDDPKPIAHVTVHETHVVSDRQITDPNDPLAVIVPEAGRSNALTPIGRVYGVDGPPKTPEEQFKS